MNRRFKNHFLKCVIIQILIILSLSCGSDKIPDELYGTWITSNERYKECSIEIERDSITFINGLDYFQFNKINSIDHINSDEFKWPLYKINYEDNEGNKYSLYVFLHTSNEGPLLQFKNQRQLIWMKNEVS